MSDTPHNTAGWWCAWIIATVVIPASAGSLLLALTDRGQMPVLFLVCGATLILHLAASIKLDRKGNGIIAVLLVLGGWLLMMASLFAGCLALVRH